MHLEDAPDVPPQRYRNSLFQPPSRLVRLHVLSFGHSHVHSSPPLCRVGERTEFCLLDSFMSAVIEAGRSVNARRAFKEIFGNCLNLPNNTRWWSHDDLAALLAKNWEFLKRWVQRLVNEGLGCSCEAVTE